MKEKKFSMIVLAFIFAVAIPSTIFLFSDTFSTGAVNTGGIPKLYGGAIYQDPTPYSYEFRGPAAPFIYAGTEVDYYEKKYPTQVPFEQPAYGFIPDRPLETEQIYTYKKQFGCPAGYRHIAAGHVEMYKTHGYDIQFFNGEACWKPESLVGN